MRAPRDRPPPGVEGGEGQRVKTPRGDGTAWGRGSSALCGSRRGYLSCGFVVRFMARIFSGNELIINRVGLNDQQKDR